VTIADEPRNVAGAMEVALRRELPDGGLIEFESAPIGFLTKGGEPRRAPWRAYFYTDPCGVRRRYPSVTTWLSAVLPKDLTRFGEEHGIRGLAELVRRGEWNPREHTDEDAVQRVRAAKLGAEAARDRAATRGTDAHALVEAFLETGEPPSIEDWPVEMHGYVRALTWWYLATNPEPLEVEQLVASPTHGYAGRVDLIARIDGVRALVDFKTNPRAQLWPGGHFQTRAYARASVECGLEPCERVMLVCFAADGAFREMDCCVDDAGLDAALAFYAAVKPVNAACEVHNRAERDARRLAA